MITSNYVDSAPATASSAPAHGSPELYSDRQRAFTDAAQAERSRIDRIARARLLVFVLIVVTGGLLLRGSWGALGWLAPVGLTAGFIFLRSRQRNAERERARNSALARINRDAFARATRFWAVLPLADPPAETDSPIARDLNLFGRGSLFQLLGTAATSSGRRTLASWLTDPAPPDVVEARQAAVQELAGQLELRQEVERQARQTPATTRTIETFRSWAETESPSGRSVQLMLARALPVALLVLALAHWWGLLPPIWLAFLPLNALIWLLGAGRAGDDLAGVDLRAEELRSYGILLRTLETASFDSKHLRGLQTVIRTEGIPAHRWIVRLQRIVELAEVRYSPILYVPLQLATLWDTHVLHLLHRWRSSAGVQVGAWMDAIGEFEALSALAGLSFDNPDWIFPTIGSDAGIWIARQLGHPMLRDEDRVSNDVALGPAGSFLFVTGSNMSGKSTLLRAIGVNTVLAQAGGPVCAAELTMPPTRLGTSFVIEDSLESGVSFFMAELRRLKVLIEESARFEGPSGWRYLFLLDEILRGTNSVERQIAVRRVLLELLDNGAIGAISSHDLALAEAEELKQRSVPVHFREHFRKTDEGTRMDFDFRLREGIATTSNALALLELIGIPERVAEKPIRGEGGGGRHE